MEEARFCGDKSRQDWFDYIHRIDRAKAGGKNCKENFFLQKKTCFKLSESRKDRLRLPGSAWTPPLEDEFGYRIWQN